MKTKSLKSIVILAVLFVFSTACKKDAANSSVDCSTSQNRDIENFFNALTSGSTYEIYNNMDLLTHEYTFTTSVNIQICGFGYKSADPNLSYEIKLVDANNNVIYSGNHSFSNTSYDYISIPPVTLSPGTYTLSRTLLNPSSVNDQVGPVTRRTDFQAMDFPKTVGNITFVSSNFYGAGGPVPDYGIPNIYFEYIEL